MLFEDTFSHWRMLKGSEDVVAGWDYVAKVREN